MMRTQTMPLDKRAVIAQGLYGMAVQDKTQPVRFLTPGTRRQLAERLDQYRTLLPWMTSEQPMTDEPMQRLIRHAEDCRGVFPPLPPSTRAALAAGCTAENQGPPDEAERLLLVEMDMLLNAAEQWLARPGSLRSGPWITGILAPPAAALLARQAARAVGCSVSADDDGGRAAGCARCARAVLPGFSVLSNTKAAARPSGQTAGAAEIPSRCTAGQLTAPAAF